MKKILLVSFLALSASAFAQSTMKEEVDIIQANYGKSKKELIGSYMKLTEPKASAFWKLYDEYEKERKDLGKKKIQIVSEYANNYEKLTEEKADEIVKSTIKNNIAYEKLFEKYYEKTKGILGAIDAAKFVQLEAYLQTSVRSEIQDAIPFVGEIERAKPMKK